MIELYCSSIQIELHRAQSRRDKVHLKLLRTPTCSNARSKKKLVKTLKGVSLQRSTLVGRGTVQVQYEDNGMMSKLSCIKSRE